MKPGTTLPRILLFLAALAAFTPTAVLAVTAAPGPVRPTPVFVADMSDFLLRSFTLSGGPSSWTTIGTGGDYHAGDTVAGQPGKLLALNDDLQQLHRFDTATGAGVVVGASVPAVGHAWTGLTWSRPGGRLYACSTNETLSILYTVNSSTGAVSQVGTITNATAVYDLAAHPWDGFIYAVDMAADKLVKIDPATGAGTVVGSLGFDASFTLGMDFDDVTGTLYLAAFNDAASGGEWRTINTTTGASTLLGPFPGGSAVDSLAVAAATRCTTVPAGLIAWWTGDDTANDLAGSHPGTWSGSAAHADGKVGRAFDFTGTPGLHVDIAQDAGLTPTTGLSVEAWVMLTSYPPVNQGYVVRSDGTGWNIQILTDGKPSFYVATASGGNGAPGADALPLGKTVHLAGTYDAVSGIAKMYVDGEQVPTNILTPGETIQHASSGAIISDGFYPLAGVIDEVRLYGRALTAAEVRASHRAQESGACKAGADLLLDGTVLRGGIFAGETFSDFLTVANGGFETATGTVLEYTVPAGLSFVSATPPGCFFDGGTGKVACDLETIPRGSSVAVTVTLRGEEPGDWERTVSVSSPTGDLNPADNSASMSINVVEQSDVSVTLQGVPATVPRGLPVTFTLTAANAGPSDAEMVTFSAVLPPELAYVSWASTQVGCGVTGNQVDCYAGTLAAGASVTVTIVATATTVGTVDTTATVLFLGTDPDATNDTAIATTVVIPAYLVKGVVRTAAGLPMRNVVLRLRQGTTVIRSVLSGRRGNFFIKGVVPGVYTLRPGNSGYLFLPRSRKITVTGADVSGKSFTGYPR